MNKILLIVEGEAREKSFFDRYKKVKKMENNLDVVPFRQNLKELYKECCKYIFNGVKPDNIIDILRESNISNEEKKKLDGKFTDIYLIFDLDIQNAECDEQREKYLDDVKTLVDFFNDSTTIGQILINYPMMDSIYHIHSPQFDTYKDISIASDVVSSKKYKDFLSKNKLSFDCSKLVKNDFDMMAAINLKKANYIVRGIYTKADHDTYFDYLNQKTIFLVQTDNILKKDIMFVLNSSLFIDIDLFGKALYFHERGERLYDDSALIESLNKK